MTKTDEEQNEERVWSDSLEERELAEDEAAEVEKTYYKVILP